MTISDPVWDTLLRDIVLTIGDRIFPQTGDQLGFGTPRKPTHAALCEFFGVLQTRVEANSTGSLLDAALTLCQGLINENQNTGDDTTEWDLNDPWTLGWCLRFHGLWPQLRNYITIITATTAVGPTHAFTIYFSVRSTSFMGDLQGAQDRATSALTRSKGLLLLIANFIALAHACKSSTHVKDYWHVSSIWEVPEGVEGERTSSACRGSSSLSARA